MTLTETRSERVFRNVNTVFLTIVAIFCVLPIIHVLALSLSSSAAAAAGDVVFWPKDFTIQAYDYSVGRRDFWRALGITLRRLVVGVPINMALTVLCAYPLHMSGREFRSRTFYTWFFFITILFNGGLVPWYVVVTETGLRNTIWALIVPRAVPVFNVILLLNFFRTIPKEISESAYIDGASHPIVLWRIYLPLSKPALATLVLFCFVHHWNDWFDGLILMSTAEKYPLQTYLQNIVVQRDYTMYSSATQEQLKELAEVSDRTSKAAQIFIAALPVLAIYPYLQKHFVKGIVIGSVKG